MSKYPLLVNSFPRCTEAQVERFEKSIGYSLPTDYRNFLREVNGGDSVVDIGVMMQQEFVAIESFTSLNEMFPKTSIDFLRGDWFAPQIPDAIPIAFTNYYAVFAMALSEPFSIHLADKLSYQDHQSITTCPKIAESFSDLLSKIVLPPDLRENADYMCKSEIEAAAYMHDPVTFRRLLKSTSQRWLFKEFSGNETIRYCCVSPILIEILLDEGFDPNSILIYETDQPPLLGNLTSPDCASLLVKHGAKIEMKDVNGMTPLHRSVKASQCLLSQYFVEAGANRLALSNGGESIIEQLDLRDTYLSSSFIDLLAVPGQQLDRWVDGLVESLNTPVDEMAAWAINVVFDRSEVPVLRRREIESWAKNNLDSFHGPEDTVGNPARSLLEKLSQAGSY